MRLAARAKRSVKQLLPAGATSRTMHFGVARGIRIETDLRGGDLQRYLGLYEVELSRHLRALARPGSRCFDVGGNVGYDALVIAKLTGAEVVTIECEPAIASVLRANVARNPELGPIRVEEGLVSSSTSGGSLTLDDLAARHFTPDFIKIDIEGGEVRAIQGARRLLASRGPALIVEVHGEEAEWGCLELLREAGYGPPLVVDPRRWLREHRPLAHNRWLVFAEARRR